jgi:hypothetical protein
MHHATKFVNPPCADLGFAKQSVATHPKRTMTMVLHPLWDRMTSFAPHQKGFITYVGSCSSYNSAEGAPPNHRALRQRLLHFLCCFGFSSPGTLYIPSAISQLRGVLLRFQQSLMPLRLWWILGCGEIRSVGCQNQISIRGWNSKAKHEGFILIDQPY